MRERSERAAAFYKGNVSFSSGNVTSRPWWSERREEGRGWKEPTDDCVNGQVFDSHVTYREDLERKVWLYIPTGIYDKPMFRQRHPL